MSPRAAWRLERLGFQVYDYVGGKADWLAAGLATVRADASERRALDGAVRTWTAVGPETLLGDVPPGSVIVSNDEGIVLGRVASERNGDPGRTVEEVMAPGPTSVRAHEPLDPLLERMRQRGVAEVLVTTPEGRLLGVVHNGADAGT